MCSHAWCDAWSKSLDQDIFVPLNDLPGHSRLRSAAAGQYDVPFTRTQFGRRALFVAAPTECNNLPAKLRSIADIPALSVAAPTEWNNLLANLRSIADITAFKTAIKTHFFRQAYS